MEIPIKVVINSVLSNDIQKVLKVPFSDIEFHCWVFFFFG